MKKYLIYALQDPISYEIRYIGLSTIGTKRITQIDARTISKLIKSGEEFKGYKFIYAARRN
jgi:hypothetical protein